MSTFGVAKFDFTGQEASELSFKKGARILVLQEKEPGDWWKGELDGKRGYFPSSYCDIVREETTKPKPPPPSQPPAKRGSVAERAAMFGGGSTREAPAKPSRVTASSSVAAKAAAFTGGGTPPAPPQRSIAASSGGVAAKAAAFTGGSTPAVQQRPGTGSVASKAATFYKNTPSQSSTASTSESVAFGGGVTLPNTPPRAPPRQLLADRTTTTNQQETTQEDSLSRMSEERISEEMTAPPPPPPPRPPSKAPDKQVRALFDFAPRRAEETALKRGSVYTVLAERSDAWLVVFDPSTSQRGEVPKNYVEPYQDRPLVVQQSRPQSQRIAFEFAATGDATKHSSGQPYQLGAHQIYRYGCFLGALGGCPRRVDVPGGEAPNAPLVSARVSAEVLRVALSRTPQSGLTSSIGKMLKEFCAICDRVAHAVATRDPAVLHDIACQVCARVYKAAPNEIILLPGGHLPDEQGEAAAASYLKRQGERQAFAAAQNRLQQTRVKQAPSSGSKFSAYLAKSRRNKQSNSDDIGDADSIPPPSELITPPQFRFEARVVLYLLRRRKDKPNMFTFCVVNANADSGSIDVDECGVSRYHPIRPCEKTTSMEHKTVLELEDVPQEKLIDGGIWFILYRLLVFPHKSHDAALLYERILPCLNAIRPVLANSSERSLWRRAPPARDLSQATAVCEALVHACLLMDAPGAIADGLVTNVRLQLVKMALADVSKTTSLSSRDAASLDSACRLLARHCAQVAQLPDSPIGVDMLTDAQKAIRDLDARVAALEITSIGNDDAPTLAASLATKKTALPAPGGAVFPLFGRFRRDADVDHLAGSAVVPPIQLPVELSSVPDAITDYHSAAIALRKALHVCTLLANQAHLIRHTYLLRCALLQHVLTRVLPLPLPLDRPDGETACFWRCMPIRYETQADLLRLLRMLARHYTCAALSLRLTRSFDAARILTTGCLAVISDAVLRRTACDVPSWVSRHYNGDADGPTRPYGFDLGLYDVESQFSAFIEPHLCVARTAVLDYFASIGRVVNSRDRMLFAFERAALIGSAEHQLLSQLCLQTGFPVLEQPEVYLTGERPELLDCYPELGLFRDIVFTFKALQAPTSDGLPPVRAWRPEDAALFWSSRPNNPKPKDKRPPNYKVPQRTLVVKAFSGYTLAIQYDDVVEKDSQKKGVVDGAVALAEEKRVTKRSTWRHFLDIVGLGRLPRAPPSKADPSVLIGQKVQTEEDILFVRHLPDFDGQLNARDSELLLTYLTAPYIRVPLLLRFFSDHARLRALGNAELRDVLDAALYEPSLWQPPGADAPRGLIPTVDRRELATPCGLLFNELRCSPRGVAMALDDMLDAALELDTGRFSPTTTPTLLYIIRTIVRVEGFCLFLLRKHGRCLGGHEPPHEMRWLSVVRGLECSDDTLSVLEDSVKRWRVRLDAVAFPMLARWVRHATNSQQLGYACVIYAHLAYLYRNLLEPALDRRAVATLLTAQIFLNVHYAFDVEPDPPPPIGPDGKPQGPRRSASARTKFVERANDELGFAQTEIADVFARHRGGLIRWLEAHPAERSSVLEAIVRTITFTRQAEEESDDQALVSGKAVSSGRSGSGKEGAVAARRTTVSTSKLTERTWAAMERADCAGRYVPDTERIVVANANYVNANENFETWLRRVTTTAVDTEVNAQLGEFTLKKHTVKALEERIQRMADFVDVFGPPHAERRIQCAEVRHTTRRNWLGLVGRRHDVQHWDAETDRFVDMPTSVKHYTPIASSLVQSTDWVAVVFEPTRRYFFGGNMKFYFTQPPNEVFAVLACSHEIEVDASELEDDEDEAFVSTLDDDAEFEDDDDAQDSDDPETAAEQAAAQYADAVEDSDATKKLKAEARDRARKEARKEAMKQASDKKLSAKDRAALTLAVKADEHKEKQEKRQLEREASTTAETADSPTTTKKKKKIMVCTFSTRFRYKTSG
mmetsp:Transcript_14534/g.21938  ORF Transcript_14534/g.21938 Transcript_14534/m.21938 type:complete len:1946 (+) Transcript_14534:90-5927(+)